ncbi:MAG: hypothetical protein ACJAWW_001881 [Sulfurimonas sp.]|jgi:hypothetical protein
MKNILLVDSDIRFYNFLKSLSNSMGRNLFTHDNYEDSVKSYLSDEIDLIIIDSALDYSKPFLNYIEKNFPNQRTLVISEELEYSVSEGCEACIRNYNRKRILKPIDIPSLIHLLNNFDEFECICRNKFSSPDGLIEIMEYIVKRFSGMKYFSEGRILFNTENQSLEDITIFLQRHHIPFQIIDETKIQL